MLRLVLILVLCVSFASCDTLFFQPFGVWGAEEERKPNNPNPICPDKQGSCPDKSTCCMLSSGKYGCCPLLHAVCCSDHTHCCPEGTTCDLTSGACMRGSIRLDWVQLMYAKAGSGGQLKNEASAKKVMGVVPGVGLKQQQLPRQKQNTQNPVPCPGKKTECPGGNTCCALTDKTYGCCPLPQAVCCSDHQHCCPNGYKCSSKATCKKSDGQGTVVWLDLVLGTHKQHDKEDEPSNLVAVSAATAIDAESVVCPGGKFSCPDKNTCCKLSSGEYGCCPYPNAVCCSDGAHCCPQGYKCDITTSQCQRTEPQPYLVNLLTSLTSIDKAAVRTESSHDNPKFSPMLRKLEAKPVVGGELDVVVCQGGKFQCPSGSTCCKAPSGSWECCPLVKAVCCADGEHCCPHGNTCDLQKKTCVQNTMTDSPSTGVEITEVKCPDQTSTCPDHTTCCQMKNGYYGCCQYDEAVCCNDFIHCCPKDMQCNVTTGTCSNSHYTLRFGQPESAKVPVVSSGSTGIECPDKKSTCPDKTTCCELPQGGYGCCAFEKAQCCSDHVHCCPDGQKCDVKGERCVSDDNEVTEWRLKFKATVKEQNAVVTAGGNVVCGNSTSTCAAGQTCCKLSPTQWGCCPFENAVCCNYKYCCAHGYTCNTAQSTCTKGVQSVQWFTKRPALPSYQVSIGDVTCPDQSKCGSGQTCCRTLSGQYACCPLPNAVCCSDDLHCCPANSRCDVKGGRCVPKETEAVPVTTSWYTVKRNLRFLPSVAASDTDRICPGRKVRCPHKQTCCKLFNGEYGCCPMPSAVCCKDGKHCCPHGSTCDEASGMCQTKTDDFSSVAMGDLTVSESPDSVAAEQESSNDVVCPDKKESCHHDNTCCKTQSGSYGCCPLPAAVCCSDGTHCCPHGSTCDVAAGTCKSKSNSLAVTWDRIHSRPVLETPLQVASVSDQGLVGAVVCADKSECPWDSTCCKSASGKYTCCSGKNAMCCNDHVTCCPSGFNCSAQSGQTKCVKAGTGIVLDAAMHSRNKPRDTSVIPWQEKVAALKVSGDPNAILCPDKVHECRNYQTCCKMGQGWGCCPYNKAVCCSDNQHCCPPDYNCDTKQMACKKKRWSSPPF